MLDKILQEIKPKMEEQINKFFEEIKILRAGRAETSLIEDIMVSFYGTTLPIKQMASISTPSTTEIIIKPWDKNALGDIEMAIRNSNLSLNPTNDGNLIRINLPPLSEERRKELVKIIHQKGEEYRIILRTLRQDAWQKVVRAEREHQISEDDRYRGEEELNKIIEQFNEKIEKIASQKETEIMRV